MPPDERELHVDMPRSLAALERETFEEVVQIELAHQVEELMLDTFCPRGGYSRDVEIDAVVVEEESESEVSGRIFLTFTEVVESGCSDIEHRESRIGDVDFILDKKTGKGVLIPGPGKREMDRDDPDI